MKRRTISLHYCNRCRMTTRHTETLEAATCSRCGTEKPMGRGTRYGHKSSREGFYHEGFEAEREEVEGIGSLQNVETEWN